MAIFGRGIGDRPVWRPLSLVLLSWLAVHPAVAADPAAVTPSRVYAEALVIGQRLELMERHLGVTEEEWQRTPLRLPLKPRHTAQLSYELLFKLNRLREQRGMPTAAAGALEPRLEVEPLVTYEQLRRVRTELDLLLVRLGIDEPAAAPPAVEGKAPIDVYNKLRELSRQIDHINGDELVPSQVFGETMRIYADINTILAALRITDETVPPTKEERATPVDAYRIGYQLLGEVQRLQRMADIPRTDFSEFEGAGKDPEDVFEMTQLILAELQTVKAHLGLRFDFTPPARHYTGKRPAEVQQVLGWCRRKLWLIDNNNFFR
ncbi:hypothetical protein [Endothiovibrio diazotrophicus]